MKVIIKLNGFIIGEATMSVTEIRNAQAEGFTITRRENN